jgi:hypothetical protein
MAVDAKFLRNANIVHAICFEENNAAAQDNLLWGAMGCNPGFKQFPVFIRERD